MDTALLRTLQNIGFDDKEARVYLALVELGQATATEIAERAELKRAIVYHVVDRLKAKGFASEIPGSRVKRFSASDPQKIFHAAKIATEDFRFMLPLLRALHHKGKEKPRIEFLEGKDAVISVYRTYEHGHDVRYVTSLARLIKLMPDEIEGWVHRMETGVSKVKARHLISQTRDDKAWARRARPLGQKIRFLPAGVQMDMDFAIVDNIVGITSFDPTFIVVITSEAIARSAAVLFDLAWGNAGRR